MNLICAIESLEARSLMSVASDAAELPSVRLISRSVVSGGTGHTFQLIVNSPAGLSPAAVGDEDVLVSGPRGFVAAADVVRVANSADHTRQIVTCRVDAPGGFFDRSDNGIYRVAVREGGIVDESGAAAPAGTVGGFRVVARRAFAHVPPPVLPIPTSASAGALSVELTRVYPWCDHMPWVGPEPDSREFLVLQATLRNTSDQPLEVHLAHAYWSFDEAQLGAETDKISVRGTDGRPSGVKSVILRPGESRVVQFRGDGVYPEDNHNRRLFITLQFVANDATVAVRNSGIVLRTD